jgi:hypothetical protein
MLRDPYRLIGFFVMSVALLSACKGNEVGQRCILQTNPDEGPSQATVVASASLDCDSRLCLHNRGKSPDMCTAFCKDDSECETAQTSPCKNGFTCAVPVVTGAFCCQKMCICREQIGLDPGASLPEPAGCDASDSNAECCNLEGRRGNPSYPTCTI